MKAIQPYLQRAQELKQREPVIAYYCKFYATKQGLTLKDRSPEDTKQLMALLDELELEKSALSQNDNYKPILASDDASYAYLSQFALKIFYQADSMDRQQIGQVPKKPIALTYLAAKLFLDVLGVFGTSDDPAVQEKVKYAKWRAAEISKAMKENRPAVAPPSDEDLDQPQQTDDAPSYSLHQPPSESPQQFDQSPQQPNQSNQPDLPTQSPKSQSPKQAQPPPTYQPPATKAVDTSIVDQATKHCRFVISSLQYDDVPTAIKNLELALALLKKL